MLGFPSLRRVAGVLLLSTLAACTPSGGDDWRNGQIEDHVDPGPSDIANTFANLYVTVDSAAVPGTLRGQRVLYASDDDPQRDDEDDQWVYVERTSDGQPTERTIYRIAGTGQPYTVRVYDVPASLPPLPPDIEPNLRFAADDLFEGVVPSDLSPRTGCTISFARSNPGDYLGVTDGTACPPSDSSASHALTEILSDRGVLSIWTRDVDTNGDTVAGPTAPTVYRLTDR